MNPYCRSSIVSTSAFGGVNGFSRMAFLSVKSMPAFLHSLWYSLVASSSCVRVGTSSGPRYSVMAF